MTQTEGGLQVLDLRKSYGSVEVLKGVDLSFSPGEVHALLGANGAGKSTLLSCLSGATKPTSGVIQSGGRNVRSLTPREALESGTAIIYQHFQLAPTLTVADNVFLGNEIATWGCVRRRRRMERETSEVLERIGVDVDPTCLVGDLSVGDQQIVEIARAIRREPMVLILDEPTAALGRHEVAALLALVKRLAHEHSIAVVFVTHLLGEVLEVADRISILRGGRVLWTRSREETSLADLVSGISPDVIMDSPAERESVGSTLARLDGFETSYCGPMSLEVRAGEIVGVFALLGGGRTNLLETIAGARPSRGGSVAIRDVRVNRATPRTALASGIALVASDRLTQSLFASLTALENTLMPHYSTLGRVRSMRRERRIFMRLADRLRLSPPSPEVVATSFSGGNAQKLAVGRWIGALSQIKLLLLDEPTQGVDIGSRAQIYALLREFVSDKDRAVLFATNDPDEAVALADRVVVLVEGQVRAVVSPSVGEEELLALAQSLDVTGDKNYEEAAG